MLIARFFNIPPSQDWPHRLDNPVWWHSHLVLQYAGGVATVVGVALILMVTGGNSSALHVPGWIVVVLALLSSSPDAPGHQRRSDRRACEAITSTWPRRLVFEHIHKQFNKRF